MKQAIILGLFLAAIMLGACSESKHPTAENQKSMEPQAAIYDSLTKGETRTYNVGGSQFIVTLTQIDDSEQSAKFTVNGVTTEPLQYQGKHISEDPKFQLQVLDVISTDGLVSFSLSEDRASFGPSKCTFGPQFACTEWSVTEDGTLTIRVQNNVGSTANVQLLFSGYDCETETEVFSEVRNGRAVSSNDEALTISCDRTFVKREWFSADIIAQYQTTEGELQTTKGFIQTKVR